MAAYLQIGMKIGHEYPAADEDAIAAKMINELTAQLERLYKDKKTLRQIHPKMHGCVKAAFVVEKNLPEDFRKGIFKEENSFHAWVRMSNASTNPKPDGKKDVRGFAIKLMGVPGDKILNDAHLNATQDFLLMNTETFFSKNVEQFSGLLSAATSSNKLRLLMYALNPLHWSLLKKAAKANIHCKNPLELPYWSTQPYQFGDTSTAVKYFLKPSPKNNLVVANLDDDDYLRVNLAQTLNDNEARFDFFIQLQTDAVAMPIEDSTIPWGSQYIKLATLIIPPQEFDSKAQMEFGDNLSFNSWHCLPAHRPLGNFNRIRKRVYEALSKFRHERNEIPNQEPKDEPGFLPPSIERNETIDVEVPSDLDVVSKVSLLVDCTKETAFNFISSSVKLTDWLKKSGPVAAVSRVENLDSAYNQVGDKRKVVFENGDSVQEELIRFHPSANYAYRVTLFSDFLKHFTKAAYGELWFDRVGAKTRITWVYAYHYKHLLGGLILWLFNKLVFKRYMKKGLQHAQAQIENNDE